MKIFLAGYNVDSEVLEELKKKSPHREDITPEILSASYARISREPVSLVDYTPGADTKLIASLLHTISSLSYDQCSRKAIQLKQKEKRDYLKAAFQYMEFNFFFSLTRIPD